MAGAPSIATVLEAWETASAQPAPYRPLTVLSLLTSRERTELEVLTVGERDGLILRLRAALFGQAMAAVTTCPDCGVEVELSFEVRSLLLDTRPVVRDVVVESEEGPLTVHPVTAGDLEAVAMETCDVRHALLLRCFDRGPVNNLSEALSAEVGRVLADSDPYAIIRLDLVCPECGATSSRRFDPWTYFWSELRSWAQAMFQQVHVLARAYGWTEREILGLSAVRREKYLRLVAR